MTTGLYLPLDEVTGSRVDFDRAADFLELSAFFSTECMTTTSALANGASIGAEDDYFDLDAEMTHGAEELVDGAVSQVKSRQDVLDGAYPFRLDETGDVIVFDSSDQSLGSAAYLLCLVLSNLQSGSEILTGSGLHPKEKEVSILREYFQYFATAALAAEIQGRAWSFGFPRRDGSGFVDKLTDIWKYLRDGHVDAQPGAPASAKDDQVDVFAARPHRDQLPGFPLAAAQVATGKNMRSKSLLGHLAPFKSRWFSRQPVTEMTAYMIVPFALSPDQFIDDVRTLGNVLHRLRVPRRVAEAEDLVKAGVPVEGYERLADARQWLDDYRGRLAV